MVIIGTPLTIKQTAARPTRTDGPIAGLGAVVTTGGGGGFSDPHPGQNSPGTSASIGRAQRSCRGRPQDRQKRPSSSLSTRRPHRQQIHPTNCRMILSRPAVSEREANGLIGVGGRLQFKEEIGQCLPRHVRHSLTWKRSSLADRTPGQGPGWTCSRYSHRFIRPRERSSRNPRPRTRDRRQPARSGALA